MATAGRLTRSRLLVRAAGTGGAVLSASAVAGSLAAPAVAAERELDLAWLRFGVSLEFVSSRYYVRARRSGLFSPAEARVLERATAEENAHKKAFREALQAAGEAPIDDADLEVVFPASAFEKRSAAISLGRRIEAMSVHAYLGSLVEVVSPAFRGLLGPIAASEAEQLSFLKGLSGPVVTGAFPSVHGLPTPSDELARYLP